MAKRVVKPTSERYVQRQVILYLRKFGWHTVNTSGAWRAARGMAGFPDVVAFKAGNTLLVECKSVTGELRPAQKKFHERLKPHVETSPHTHLAYGIVRAGEFEGFIDRLKLWYLIKPELEWTKEMDTWRPKHDHLI